jgi:diguanylate cyclase (GGDEF)-like protein
MPGRAGKTVPDRMPKRTSGQKRHRAQPPSGLRRFALNMIESLLIGPPAPPVSSGADAERQATLRRTGVLDRGPEPEFDRWTAALAAETGAAVAALVLVDATRMFVKSLSTAGGAAGEVSELALSESLAEHLIGRADPSAASALPPACAEAPISVSGQLLGWMAIADDPDRTWGEGDLRSLNDAAAAVTIELRLRLANREAARMADLVASHNRLHDLIARDAPLHEVLSELVEGIERYEPSVIPCVVLLDRESSTLHPGAAPSLPPHYLAAIDGVIIGPNIGTCGSAAWSGELQLTPDIGEDPRWAPIRDFAMDAGLRHCWSMPIKAADDGVLGTFALYGPQPRHPLPEHLALMRDGARLAGIAIERHQTMKKLIHDARYDGLTGLPNRRAIFERLELALGRTGPTTKVAVLFVDLDGLKTLNDTLGHDRADDMIREIAQRLGPALRVDDFVGRLGGDEFVVVAEEISDPDEATVLGLRLLDATSKPLPGIDRTVVTASVGIALLDRDVDAAEAIRRADTAMYRAKNSGRDRYAVFEDTERRASRRPLSLARALRNPEIRNEMSLAFQPVFDLAGSELVAVEALMRWTSPSFGVVGPREFIPIAESSGMIVPLGAWALRESCETVARIAEETGRWLELAVNVSAHQVAKPGFAQSVYQALRHAKYPAELVTLEITETALMQADARSARTLGELRSLGVRIVLDDFGTGYSSLMGLNQYPIDAIKIDRAFVDGLPGNAVNSAIVTAVIDMAKALRCTVTAEGVETETQLAALRALKCERVQGFLLGRPMPAQELVTLLRTHA